MTTERRSTDAGRHWPIPGRAAVTFHPRNGRVTAQRTAVLDELWPRVALVPTTWSDVIVAFGRRAPVVLEVGFGQGEAAAAFALQHPGHDVLAMEVHLPGIASLAQRCAGIGLTNVRIVRGDALAFMHDVVPSGALDAVHVFFPDPWPKRRQQHRRLIQPDFAALIADRLRVGGLMRCATDDAGYGDQMRSVFAHEPLLHLVDNDRPAWRPTTKFEARAQRAHRPVTEFCFARVADGAP